ncbi:hypothetical protein, partial [Marivirga sp.]|uniref:hypothetical protein n=1 Tax=Marivirga sp. TaxID=2018662 RepID=UPI003DA6F973
VQSLLSDIQNCYLTQNAIPTLSLFFAKFIYYFVAGKLNQTYEITKENNLGYFLETRFLILGNS